MTSEHESTRAASRFLASLPATITIAGRPRSCRAHNLSRSGVLMIGEMPMPEESQLGLTIASPGGDLSLALLGQVRRCELDRETNETRIAIEFGEIREKTRATLEALVSRVVEGVAPAALADLPDNPSPAEVRDALERVTLSHRIALASRATPAEREILLQDTQLQVIDAVARNPALLPHELIKILRMPNVMPQTLDAIARDQRWTGNEQVQLLVASHRNTSLAVADRLASRMPRPALQKLLRAPDLKAALRSKVLARLSPR